jgi:hypothetical protein
MNRKLFLLIILLITFGFSFKVFALEVTWPDSPLSPGFTLTDQSTLTDLVRYFYEWGLFIGGLAVLISLLIGGFLYLTSVGNPTRMSEAKDRIFSAIIGLVLLFAIYLILRTINPDLTVLTLNPIGGISCTKTEDCPKGFECKDRVCIPPITDISCNTDQDCKDKGLSGYTCKDNLCIPPAQGGGETRCDKDDDCSSLGEGYECSGGNPDTPELDGVCVKI